MGGWVGGWVEVGGWLVGWWVGVGGGEVETLGTGYKGMGEGKDGGGLRAPAQRFRVPVVKAYR